MSSKVIPFKKNPPSPDNWERERIVQITLQESAKDTMCRLKLEFLENGKSLCVYENAPGLLDILFRCQEGLISIVESEENDDNTKH